MTMKNLMMVAVYRRNDGYIETICTSKRFPYEHIKDLDENGTLLNCVITTDEVLYLNTRLNAKLMELRDYSEKTHKYIMENEDSDIDVYKETIRLMHAYEETLANQVGILTARLLSRGADITDELAIACHNYKISKQI